MGLNKTNEVDSWLVRPPWKRFDDASDGWPPIRAMTAAHVYTGLTLLYYAAYLYATSGQPVVDYSPVELQEASDGTLSRARFLAQALEENKTEFGLGGQHFISWLLGLINELHKKLDDIESPAPGSKIFIRYGDSWVNTQDRKIYHWAGTGWVQGGMSTLIPPTS